MTEQENYTDIEANDVDTMETSGLQIEPEDINTTSEFEITNNSIVIDTESTEFMNSEEQTDEKKLKEVGNKTEVVRITRLPIARIKTIMKQDPDVHLINSDALFLVTKATELFLETLAKETYTYTAAKKKKTITKKDLDTVINVVDCLCFLDGALEY